MRSLGYSLMLEGQEGVTKIELLAGEIIPKVGTYRSTSHRSLPY